MRPHTILRRTRRAIHTSPLTQRHALRAPPPRAKTGNENPSKKIPWRAPEKAVSQETKAFLRGTEGGFVGKVEEVEEGDVEGEVKRGMVVEMRR